MKARDVMTTDVPTIGPDSTIDGAIAIMTERRVTVLPVVDQDGRLLGNSDGRGGVSIALRLQNAAALSEPTAMRQYAGKPKPSTCYDDPDRV